jgi:Transposase domain (DUF772)
VLQTVTGPLNRQMELLISVMSLAPLGRLLSARRGGTGRPAKDRAALAVAFMAKAILNIPTTRDLIGRLRVDEALRQCCGWSTARAVPHESKFSRAFAEFAQTQLPQQLHEAAGTLQDKDYERTRECAAERRVWRQSDSRSRGGEGNGSSDVRGAGAGGGSVAQTGRFRLTRPDRNRTVSFRQTPPTRVVAACPPAAPCRAFHHPAPAHPALKFIRPPKPTLPTLCQDHSRGVLQVGHASYLQN